MEELNIKIGDTILGNGKLTLRNPTGNENSKSVANTENTINHDEYLDAMMTRASEIVNDTEKRKSENGSIVAAESTTIKNPNFENGKLLVEILDPAINVDYLILHDGLNNTVKSEIEENTFYSFSTSSINYTADGEGISLILSCSEKKYVLNTSILFLNPNHHFKFFGDTDTTASPLLDLVYLLENRPSADDHGVQLFEGSESLRLKLGIKLGSLHDIEIPAKACDLTFDIVGPSTRTYHHLEKQNVSIRNKAALLNEKIEIELNSDTLMFGTIQIDASGADSDDDCEIAIPLYNLIYTCRHSTRLIPAPLTMYARDEIMHFGALELFAALNDSDIRVLIDAESSQSPDNERLIEKQLNDLLDSKLDRKSETNATNSQPDRNALPEIVSFHIDDMLANKDQADAREIINRVLFERNLEHNPKDGWADENARGNKHEVSKTLASLLHDQNLAIPMNRNIIEDVYDTDNSSEWSSDDISIDIEMIDEVASNNMQVSNDNATANRKSRSIPNEDVETSMDVTEVDVLQPQPQPILVDEETSIDHEPNTTVKLDSDDQSDGDSSKGSEESISLQHESDSEGDIERNHEMSSNSDMDNSDSEEREESEAVIEATSDNNENEESVNETVVDTEVQEEEIQEETVVIEESFVQTKSYHINAGVFESDIPFLLESREANSIQTCSDRCEIELQQDFLQAIRRGLNGTLTVSTESFNALMSKMGIECVLPDPTSEGSAVLPLLDFAALSAALSVDQGLKLQQVHRGLISMLECQETEEEYRLLREAELNRLENRLAAVQRDSLTSFRLLQLPLRKWNHSLVMEFTRRVAGDNIFQKNHRKLTGKELAQAESQGYMALIQLFNECGVQDELMRQRLQFHTSLSAIRSKENVETANSGYERSSTYSDTHWTAGPKFGVRAKIALHKWASYDVLRFFRFLKLPNASIATISEYAIDGAALLNLTQEEMKSNFELSKEDVELVMASILLLKRAPEISMGELNFVKIHVADSGELKPRPNMIAFYSETVYNVMLNPGLQLVESVRSVTRICGADTEVKIWYRVLEYESDSIPAEKVLTNGNEFTDASTMKFSQLYNSHINGKGKVLRWDPQESLLETEGGGIVKGWRYLTTTNVRRGEFEEFAKLALCFNRKSMSLRKDENKVEYRICFCFQLAAGGGGDLQTQTIRSLSSTQGTNYPASRFYSISDPFIVLNRPKPKQAPRRKKTVMKSEALTMSVSAKKMNVLTSSEMPKISAKNSESQLAPTKSVVNPPTIMDQEETRVREEATNQIHDILASTNQTNTPHASEVRSISKKNAISTVVSTTTKVTRKTREMHMDKIMGATTTQQDTKASVANRSITSVTEGTDTGYIDDEGIYRPALIERPVVEEFPSLRVGKFETGSPKKTSPPLEKPSAQETTSNAQTRIVSRSLDARDLIIQGHVPERKLSQENVRTVEDDSMDIVRYPLRPNAVTPVATASFHSMRLLVDSIRPSRLLESLATQDTSHRGWIALSVFTDALNCNSEIDWDVAGALEILEENLQTAQYLRSIAGIPFVKYESVLKILSDDKIAYVVAVSNRIYQLARSMGYDLPFLFRIQQRIAIETLQYFDVDMSETTYQLLVSNLNGARYLQMPMLTHNEPLLLASIMTGLRMPTVTDGSSKMDLAAYFDMYDVNNSGSVSLETLGTVIHRYCGASLTSIELGSLCNMIDPNWSPGLQVCYRGLIVNEIHSCTGDFYDTERIVKLLVDHDPQLDGYVELDDMYDALCSSVRDKYLPLSIEKQSQLKSLALDYELSGMQYSRWLKERLQFSAADSHFMELRRFGRWLARQPLSTQEKVVSVARNQDTSGMSTYMSFQKVLSDLNFELHLQDAESFFHESNNSGLNPIERILKTSSRLVPEISIDIARVIDASIVIRLSEVNYTSMMEALTRYDEQCDGNVSHDNFIDAVGISNVEMKSLCSPSGSIRYEDVVLEVMKGSSNRVMLRYIVLSQVRRANRRCEKLYQRGLMDLFLELDRGYSGFISFPELLLQMEAFGVHWTSTDVGGKYIMEAFGDMKNSVDYENLLRNAYADHDDASEVLSNYIASILRRFFAAHSDVYGLHQIVDTWLYESGSEMTSGVCSLNMFNEIWKLMLPSNMSLEKSQSALEICHQLYGSSDTQEFRLHDFVSAMNKLALSGDSMRYSRDIMRHHVFTLMYRFQKSARDAFDLVRAVDGDLDGIVSLRNMNEVLQDAVQISINDSLVQFILPHNVDPMTVLYEEFLEQSLYILQGSTKFNKHLSGARLRSMIRRINKKTMETQSIETSEAVFSFLSSGTSVDITTGESYLTDWDLFYMIREHTKLSITMEDLVGGLKSLFPHNETTSVSLHQKDWILLNE